MGRLIIPLLIFVLLVITLIDCLSTDESEIRGLPKVIWVFVILLFPLVGSIAWYFAGRPKRAARTGPPPPGTGLPQAGRPGRPGRPIAPDDDPEFLSGLAKQTSRDDEELLRRWEEDLRRREDKLRNGEDGDATKA